MFEKGCFEQPGCLKLVCTPPKLTVNDLIPAKSPDEKYSHLSRQGQSPYANGFATEPDMCGLHGAEFEGVNDLWDGDTTFYLAGTVWWPDGKVCDKWFGILVTLNKGMKSDEKATLTGHFEDVSMAWQIP